MPRAARKAKERKARRGRRRAEVAVRKAVPDVAIVDGMITEGGFSMPRMPQFPSYPPIRGGGADNG